MQFLPPYYILVGLCWLRVPVSDIHFQLHLYRMMNQRMRVRATARIRRSHLDLRVLARLLQQALCLYLD